MKFITYCFHFSVFIIYSYTKWKEIIEILQMWIYWTTPGQFKKSLLTMSDNRAWFNLWNLHHCFGTYYILSSNKISQVFKFNIYDQFLHTAIFVHSAFFLLIYNSGRLQHIVLLPLLNIKIYLIFLTWFSFYLYLNLKKVEYHHQLFTHCKQIW